MNRRVTTLIGISLLVVVAGVLLVGWLALGWFHPPASTAAADGVPTATATAAASGAPPKAEVVALTKQLQSGDRGSVAVALGLDPSEVTDAEITGFNTSTLAFDTGNATSYGATAWEIPVTVTTVDGGRTQWTASVVESGGHLILLDTRAAQ